MVKRFFMYNNANNCETKDLQQEKNGCYFFHNIFKSDIIAVHKFISMPHLTAYHKNCLLQKFHINITPIATVGFANVTIKFLFFYFSFEKNCDCEHTHKVYSVISIKLCNSEVLPRPTRIPSPPPQGCRIRSPQIVVLN